MIDIAGLVKANSGSPAPVSKPEIKDKDTRKVWDMTLEEIGYYLTLCDTDEKVMRFMSLLSPKQMKMITEQGEKASQELAAEYFDTGTDGDEEFVDSDDEETEPSDEELEEEADEFFGSDDEDEPSDEELIEETNTAGTDDEFFTSSDDEEDTDIDDSSADEFFSDSDTNYSEETPADDDFFEDSDSEEAEPDSNVSVAEAVNIQAPPENTLEENNVDISLFEDTDSDDTDLFTDEEDESEDDFFADDDEELEPSPEEDESEDDFFADDDEELEPSPKEKVPESVKAPIQKPLAPKEKIAAGTVQANKPAKIQQISVDKVKNPVRNPVGTSTRGYDVSNKKNLCGEKYQDGWSLIKYLQANRGNKKACSKEVVLHYYSLEAIERGEDMGKFVISKGILRF